MESENQAPQPEAPKLEAPQPKAPKMTELEECIRCPKCGHIINS